MYGPLYMGRGQGISFGIARLGGPAHRRAAGIAQPQRARHLVEGFAGCVVHRPAKDLEMGVVLHPHNMAVPAAGNEA